MRAADAKLFGDKRNLRDRPGHRIGSLLAQAARFGIVGFANTGLTLVIIAGLELGFSTDRQISNAVGYAAGMLLSYALNKRFVFRRNSQTRSDSVRFVITLGGAFLINQAILAVAARFLGDGSWGRLTAQLIGMVSYTVVSFFLCRTWVFRERDRSGGSRGAGNIARSDV